MDIISSTRSTAKKRCAARSISKCKQDAKVSSRRLEVEAEQQHPRQGLHQDLRQDLDLVRLQDPQTAEDLSHAAGSLANHLRIVAQSCSVVQATRNAWTR